MSDPSLERWRLILGAAASASCGQLGATGHAQDRALDWLYQRDDDLDDRGIRRGGSEESALRTVDWLDDIHRLFPKETIERLERDAIERYGIDDIVTDPAVLARVEPNAALLRAVLRTKHLMNPEVLRMARRIVEAVVRELVEKLAVEVRDAFNGTRSRRPSRLRRASSFDFRRTIRDNLGHYQPDEQRIAIETAHFLARNRRHLEPWQVILVVDQSGSMVSSVIHSAVTASCLWGLPGVRTHLIAFDTAVIDLTSEIDDPVEVLLKVQLGGGTDIAAAMRYAAGLVEVPRRTIVVLITDFFEGGDANMLVRTVRGLVHQGTKVVGLAALDEEANPSYDRATAARLVEVGAHVGAMTPGELAGFLADCMR
jgi:uncharacterized protein with von Willebrand factor type A (vWA) domain